MKRRDLLRAGLATATALGAGPFVRVARAAPASSPASFYTLEFPTPDGQPRDVAEFLGKPMVLNFWATWCPPCVKEMPDLDFLQQKYPEVHVVGLAVDTASNVVKFSERVPVSYPLLVAGHGGIRLMKDMGNPRGGLPFTIVYDAAGHEITHFLGQIQRDELDAVLRDATAQ